MPSEVEFEALQADVEAQKRQREHYYNLRPVALRLQEAAFGHTLRELVRDRTLRSSIVYIEPTKQNTRWQRWHKRNAAALRRAGWTVDRGR